MLLDDGKAREDTEAAVGRNIDFSKTFIGVIVNKAISPRKQNSWKNVCKLFYTRTVISLSQCSSHADPALGLNSLSHCTGWRYLHKWLTQSVPWLYCYELTSCDGHTHGHSLLYVVKDETLKQSKGMIDEIPCTFFSSWIVGCISVSKVRILIKTAPIKVVRKTGKI